jgi:hypothetical protein
MIIQTIFNLNENVYLLKNEKIHCVKIVKINIQYGNGIECVDNTSYLRATPMQYVSYRVRYDSGGEENFPENRLFSSKKDLINSL